MAGAIQRARRHIAAALVLFVFGTGYTAFAQDDATTRANRSAYQAAMKCFVADGVAIGDARDSGDPSKVDAFDAKARKSFDIAKKLGVLLGYSGDRMEQDFGLAQTYELPRMLKDIAYYRSAAATCKALGLM
jgi:hypothetical protein